MKSPGTDYEALGKMVRRQKAALTRAINSGDPQKVIDAVRAAVEEWEQPDSLWPDDWARWQRALADATGDPFASIDAFQSESISESADSEGADTIAAAAGLEEGWTAPGVQAALDQLADEGVPLDPTDSPETILAVLKTANVMPA